MNREYDTGAHRDSRKGKGRYDLISPYMLERLAKRLEHGATIYGDRNWEKGIPEQDFFDSAMRHLTNWQKGMRDEDHLAAVVFNIMGMIHFDELNGLRGNIPEDIMYHRIDDFECIQCNKKVDLVSSEYKCSDCVSGSVSPSKPSEVPGKVYVPNSAKDPLGGRTERQNLYDQHQATETAEMIRREAYRAMCHQHYRYIWRKHNPIEVRRWNGSDAKETSH